MAASDVYFCPGESSPVSHAVHTARLASGWQTCLQCDLRFRNSETTERYPHQAVSAASCRQPGIRRTAFGVRAAYLNDMDRTKAAQLAAIFATHLTRTSVDFDAGSESDAARSEAADGANRAPYVRCASQISIAAGFDGRRHSPDIFAGVISSIRQNGCHVIDIGRCTTASLQECLRSMPTVSAGVIVTGAGCAAGFTGIDVFDRSGEGISVPWQKYGVSVRADRNTSLLHTALFSTTRVSAAASGEVRTELHSTSVHDFLHRIRTSRDTTSEVDSPKPGNEHSSKPAGCHDTGVPGRAADENGSNRDTQQAPEMLLTLPSLPNRSGLVFRSVRVSGQHRSVDFEPEYRKWLRRWFPSDVRRRVVLFAEDSKCVERLRELVESSGGAPGAGPLVAELPSKITGNATDPAVFDTLKRFDAEAAFVVAEDDRHLKVFNRSGRQLSNSQLASWLNSATRSSALHVTAHVSNDESRILLVDAGRPQSSESHETLSDALALTGLILNLLNHRTNSLPA
ncbi:MAG: hypothetical protein R3C19_01505 [Planctomycetaceae bacterium]